MPTANPPRPLGELAALGNELFERRVRPPAVAAARSRHLARPGGFPDDVPHGNRPMIGM